MEKKISIEHKDFKKNYNSKEPQIIILKFNSDLVDPVSSFMRISDDIENSFLFESLKDGDLSGRYSVIGIKPDKILKITNKISKIYVNNNIEEVIVDASVVKGQTQPILVHSKIDTKSKNNKTSAA